MIELGYADFVIDTFHCMMAPAGTPQDIVDRLAKACIDSLKEPAFHERLRSLGFETIANGPDGLRRRIVTDVERYRAIIAKAGIDRV
jgi:tripartite-type tricarboxylate transporter receptor subunit TctC